MTVPKRDAKHHTSAFLDWNSEHYYALCRCGWTGPLVPRKGNAIAAGASHVEEHNPRRPVMTLQASDEYPKRPRAVRRIKGLSPEGVAVTATAFADPLPDTLGYGPFYGEGQVSLSRSGAYVVGNIVFDEIPRIIALLQDVLDQATAPHHDNEGPP